MTTEKSEKEKKKTEKKMKTIAKIGGTSAWHLYGDGNTSKLEITVKEYSL